MAFVKPRKREGCKVKLDSRRHIIYMKRNETMILFLCVVKKGNKCRFARHPGRNRQEERYLAAHISESVKSTRHPGGHVSVAADVTWPSPGTTASGISWSKSARACTFPDRPRRCTYTRVHIAVSYHVHTSHAEECRASGNVWVPSTVWWMRRLWRNVIGTDTRGNALTFLSCFFVLIHTSWHTHIHTLPYFTWEGLAIAI